MQLKTKTLVLSLVCLLPLLLAPSPLLADAGLVIENPDGAFGFITDAGHASVWISHGCLDPHGDAYFCEGSPGIILTGTGYWTSPGAAAIPADLYFVGPEAAPVSDPTAAWTRSLGSAYPDVSPQIGRKYIGRLWKRDVRVLVFPTSAEDDRRVIEAAQRERRDFRFSFYHQNCAAYAQHVLELYRGPLKVRRWLDLGMATPRSLELALIADLHEAPPQRTLVNRARPAAGAEVLSADGTASTPMISNTPPRLYQFASTRRQRLRPPRTLCETALFDPKYAIPILTLEPEVYPAFIGCYVLGRHHTGGEPALVEIQDPVGAPLSFQARQIATYQALIESPVQKGPALKEAERDVTGN